MIFFSVVDNCTPVFIKQSDIVSCLHYNIEPQSFIFTIDQFENKTEMSSINNFVLTIKIEKSLLEVKSTFSIFDVPSTIFNWSQFFSIVAKLGLRDRMPPSHHSICLWLFNDLFYKAWESESEKVDLWQIGASEMSKSNWKRRERITEKGRENERESKIEWGKLRRR